MHVEDTGKGITKEELSKLFTLFGKIERTEDSNPDGLGMGLTICQKIIQNSGGKIDVFSDGVNKGSTFMFQMSMKLPKEAAKTAVKNMPTNSLISQRNTNEASSNLEMGTGAHTGDRNYDSTKRGDSHHPHMTSLLSGENGMHKSSQW